MAYIAIPIPSIPGKQDIEIEVTINGARQALHYRVELLRWAECPAPGVDRVECIRHMLDDYDPAWQLYFIGAPSEDFVPITFVKKEDWAWQRSLLQESVKQ